MKYREALPAGPWGTIVADPPWRLNTPGVRRNDHYDTMTTDEIAAMPVREVASPDAHLWLWTTNPHLPEALRVVEAWGFHYRSMLTWVKPRMGLGWWLRSRTEHLLFATRTKRLRVCPRATTTVLFAKSRRHSEKPQAAYNTIELLSPAPRLEIFAREGRLGWETVMSDRRAEPARC